MDDKQYYVPKSKDETLYGKCILQILFDNEEQYENWKEYNGGKNRWDFVTSYPAIMRAEYDFHSSLDLNVITNKIVQLLQMGFNVRAADWKLKNYKSQL